MVLITVVLIGGLVYVADIAFAWLVDKVIF